MFPTLSNIEQTRERNDRNLYAERDGNERDSGRVNLFHAAQPGRASF